MFKVSSFAIMAALSLGAATLPPCDGDVPTPTVAPSPTPGGVCIETGCSGQICASEPMASTCEWKCEYGCLEFATCEPQAASACGWTYSPEYEACLADCDGSF